MIGINQNMAFNHYMSAVIFRQSPPFLQVARYPYGEAPECGD